MTTSDANVFGLCYFVTLMDERRGEGNSGQLGQEDDEDIGTTPGELAALPPVDLGSP